ncbi:hypothetical protein ASD89_02180 [Caulobacter sp. Root656]|nr:hypothetical protein ASD89_02180 [Caulobacter sp. Root656]
MSVIGHFRREGDGFAGRLATLGLKAELRLVPASRVSAKGPDYIVLVGDGEGEVGAAWRAGDASGALLNIKLDDPSWPEPVNARLMAAEGGALPLTWIRKSDPPDKPAAPPPD